LVDKESFEAGNTALTEALEIYRTLAKNYPKVYAPDVASILDRLGNLNRRLQAFATADQYFQEAIALKRKLVKQDGKIYLPDLALSLNNSAILYAEQYQFNRATTHYREVIEIFRSLASEDGAVYLPKLSAALSNLGYEQIRIHAFESAERNYLEALKINQQLSEEAPIVYGPQQANIYLMLSILKGIQNDFSKADAYGQEAINILDPLYDLNPSNFDLYMGLFAQNKAKLLMQDQQWEGAEILYKGALPIFEQYAELSMEAFGVSLGIAYAELGRYFLEVGQLDESHTQFQHALETFDELAGTTLIKELKGDLYRDWGRLFREEGQWDQATRQFQQAADYLEPLVKKYPFLNPHMAMIYRERGILELETASVKVANKYLRMALEQFNELADQYPEVYLPELAITELVWARYYALIEPDEERSMDFLRSGMARLIPFRYKNYYLTELEKANPILQHWGISPKKYLREQFPGYDR
ncbi:MAG: tetratricopeptide repeat protein, partial [Bacteroidota bacterium]